MQQRNNQNAAKGNSRAVGLWSLTLVVALVAMCASVVSPLFPTTIAVAAGVQPPTPSGLHSPTAVSQQWPSGLYSTFQAAHPRVVSGTFQAAEITATDNAANDQFANAVSVSADGSTALIGAYEHQVGSTYAAGAAYIFTKASNGNWSQSKEITASDGLAYDNFGWSVSLSGDGSTALVSAYSHKVGTNAYAGAAYIFTRASSWGQVAELTASDKAANDYFGQAVSISNNGSTVLISAYEHSVNGHTQAGSAYIFTKSGSNWSQTAELTASDAATSDYFGQAVSISGDGSTALVGAYSHKVNSNSGAGAAYIFTASSSWSQVAELTAGDNATGDSFGYAVSLSNDGSIVLIGADNRTVGIYGGAGAAYIFTKGSGNNWSQTSELTASDYASGADFGYSVSVSSDGSTALVGAYSFSAGAGDAYLFKQTSGSWSQIAEIAASDKGNANNFGDAASLSSDGSTALVGSLYHAVGSHNSAGTAYFFVTPRVTTTTVSSSANPSELAQAVTFTASVIPTTTTGSVTFNIDGSDVPVTSTVSSGVATYVTYTLSIGNHAIIAKYSGDSLDISSTSTSFTQTVTAVNSPTTFPSAELTASDNVGSDYFGYAVSVSADGSTAIVGASDHNVGSNSSAGAAYIFTKNSSGVWSQVAELTAADNGFNDQFGHGVSISNDGSVALVGAWQHTVNGKSGAGAAYIFTKASGWSQVALLTASDNATDEYFGWSVSLAGDGATALVGAYDHNIGSLLGAGASYIFTKGSGNNWSQTAELTASDAAASDFYGGSVSLSNDGATALIGDEAHVFSNTAYVGAAYIYTKASSWGQTAELRASDETADNELGNAVSLSGDGSTALVGAYAHNNSVGAAYIFSKGSGNSWSQTAELTASDNAVGDEFGSGVGMSSDGSTALIGADQHTVGSNSYTGAAYSFKKASGNSWNQINELTAFDNNSHDNFGDAASLSADGSTALVGSVYHQVNGLGDAGAAYIFITPRVTTTTVGSAANPALYNQPITLTATISPTTATGTVTFNIDGTDLAPAATISNGLATYVTNTLSVATHPVIAKYSGDSIDISSTSTTYQQIINPAIVTPTSTTTSLTSNPNPSTLGQSVTFTSTVSPATASGTVTFTDSISGTLGTGTLAGGIATYSTSNLTSGTHTITATYGGNANYSGSFTTTVQVINAATITPTSTTTSLTSNPNPSTVGQSVTFSATVSPATASGTVTFTDSISGTLGTAALVNGIATYSTSNLTSGTHTITATYGGDSNNAGSTSNTVSQIVNSQTPPPPATYTYNLPLVANNAGNFTTYLAFQNIGSATANVTINYYDNNGNALAAATVVTQVVKYGEALPSNPLASGVKGAGIITSDQPLNVIVPEATLYGGSAYAVNSGSSNSLLAPFAFNNAFGDFTTQLNLFNAGSSAVTATVTFYGTVGSNSTSPTSTTTTLTIGAHQTANLNQSSLPSGFNGWAQITGSANTLVAQVLEQSLSQKFVAIANAIASPSATEYAAAIFNGGYGSFYTGANIINPNANPVTVTVTYYDLAANAIATTPFSIGGYGVVGIFNGATSGNGIPSGGLPSNFVGSMAVSAVGGPIAMSVNENGGQTAAGNSRSGTYGAVVSGGSTVGLPVISNGGYSYITGATILNTSSQPVSATITYYNPNGTMTGVSKSFTVGGHASQPYYQGDGSLPANFYGTAVITTTGGAANALIVTTNAQNSALFYTYSEPNQ